MGTCIICGTSTEGHICDTHEEDAVFEFRGDNPNQLTTGRYYRGTVDGYADFGVFVDLASSVTGLLHKSEIPGRLESLDWEPGDDVFVQVTDIHGNGNVDLGWSIRQSEREFRGLLIDDPEAPSNAELPEEAEADGEGETPEAEAEPSVTVREEAAGDERAEPERAEAEQAESGRSGTDDSGKESHEPETETETVGTTEVPEETVSEDAAEETETAEAEETEEAEENDTAETEATEEPERRAVETLDDHVDERVLMEGEITGVRQTGGPTIFDLADETGAVDCAAFVEAGVRAYPEAEVGDVVRLVGEVERRRGELQVETEDLTVLEGDDRERVLARLEDAVTERATPESTDLLAADPAVDAIRDDVVDVATEIRRAVIEARPVIVRHTADVTGYVAGTALERALLPLVRAEHARSDAEYHYVDRRPLDDRFYDIEAATDDVTSMLEAADRHDEKHPLFVLVGTGSTRESLDGLGLLDTYDAPSVAIDGGYADGEAADAADVLVSPTQAGEEPVNTGALGAQVAALVNDDVRDDLRHLPAVAYWQDVPEQYATLAEEAGYDRETLDHLRDAVALEAFYQSYEDKRELIIDLLWDEGNVALAEHVSEQFRTKLETELETAEPHLEVRDEAGVTFDVLDAKSFTHKYDFPPVDLLLDALHRRRDADVTVVAGEDDVRLRSEGHVDVRAVGETVAEALPEAGVTPLGAEDGRIEFLVGERDAVIDAVVDAVADQLS